MVILKIEITLSTPFTDAQIDTLVFLKAVIQYQSLSLTLTYMVSLGRS